MYEMAKLIKQLAEHEKKVVKKLKFRIASERKGTFSADKIPTGHPTIFFITASCLIQIIQI